MKNEKWIISSAVVAALGASLCCIVPLLGVIFGISIFSGLAAMFAPARPFLLGAAILLLAGGFYWIYFRRTDAACAVDGECVTNRMNRVGLWIASIAVLLFAAAPYLTPSILARIDKGEAPKTMIMENEKTARVRFKVTGMTCGGCEATIVKALEKTPGVQKAEVSYERGEAVVDYNPNQTTPEKIRDAINSTGYAAEIVK